ncbi:hypothetical protein HYFRA_00002421 [Hymenoscyphus fraxineus]|uniref:Piwi domain-containing protein n=1 Tax=Hymenoscyphus fraxineus TaxID=746836 RepID=A0A9N9L7H3_9HELO|nr:hypothetical protein HYFRA_00002421 [Hymenoscyphus fraxineus]
MSEITFRKKVVQDGQEKLVKTNVRYYLEHDSKHKSKFGDDEQCVNVGGAKKDNRAIWYPISTLKIVPWQKVRRVLPQADGEKMVEVAEILPGQNKRRIAKVLEILGLDYSQPSGHLRTYFEAFGIDFVPEMERLTRKSLSAPKLNYRKINTDKLRDEDEEARPDNGEWAITKKRFFSPSKIKTLHVICFHDNSSKIVENIKFAENGLAEVMKAAGMMEHNDHTLDVKLATPKTPILPQESESAIQYRKRCQERLSMAFNAIKSPAPEIILVVMQEKCVDFYAEIKRWGDCVIGTPTVCCLGEKICGKKFNWGMSANLCLKLNAKLKGVNHQLRPAHDAIKDKFYGATKVLRNTMLVGADVTHPKNGDDGCPSIAGIVATDDPTSGNYLASARLQRGTQEEISDLAAMIKERVIAWQGKAMAAMDPKKTPAGPKRTPKPALPSHIFFYRDGVSESQLGMVRKEELPQIKEGCGMALKELTSQKKISVKAWEPKVTMFVVVKRHHARFFNTWLPNPDTIQPLSTADQEEERDNLPAGTLIDTKVVAPFRKEFYLQSHTSEKGTARSACYILIEDESGLTMEDLQEATHHFCYTGARATKCPSTCIPARYADLLCDRLRHYLRPALTNSYRPSIRSNDKSGDLDPTDFANDKNIWAVEKSSGQERDKSKNPWHKNMDGIMFYI